MSAALFALTGVAWFVRGAIGLAGPSYYAPVTALDFAAVWAMSGGLLLTAGSFLALLRDWPSPDRSVAVAAWAGAAGAVVAAIGNALEDAFDVDAGWMLFVVGAVATALALVALGAFALRGGVARRAVAGALFVAALGFFAADAGGLVLTGIAFFVLAWLHRPRPA